MAIPPCSRSYVCVRSVENSYHKNNQSTNKGREQSNPAQLTSISSHLDMPPARGPEPERVGRFLEERVSRGGGGVLGRLALPTHAPRPDVGELLVEEGEELGEPVVWVGKGVGVRTIDACAG